MWLELSDPVPALVVCSFVCTLALILCHGLLASLLPSSGLAWKELLTVSLKELVTYFFLSGLPPRVLNLELLSLAARMDLVVMGRTRELALV